jgi:hypothetical protein
LTRAYPEGTHVRRKSCYGVDLSAQPDAAAVAAAAGAAGFTGDEHPGTRADPGAGDRRRQSRADRRGQRPPHPLDLKPGDPEPFPDVRGFAKVDIESTAQ